MNNIICIIGMHRSGTSMVTHLLKLCGLALGADAKLIGSDVGNVEGHFEHIDFLKINEAILAYFGGSGANPPSLKMGWEAENEIAQLAGQARVLVDSFSDYTHWGWKDPRTTLLLPFWKKIIPNM